MNQMRRYYLALFVLIVRLLTLIAEPVSLFSLQPVNDDKDSNFDASFSLLGDAQIANGGSFVNLTSPTSGTSSGQIIYKKPFKFIDTNSENPISFSTDFTFTITPGDGDGMAFVVFPSVGDFSEIFKRGYFGISDNVDQKYVAVEYDTMQDAVVGDLNGNHVGLDMGKFVSAEVSDVSYTGLLLNGGVPLKSWIDYEASSKRLEIRLAESGTERPYNPLISYPVDLLKMWGDKDVMVAISSSSGDVRQISSLSSWSFSIRTVPSSLHSQPLNPEARDEENQPVRTKKSCFLTVLGAVIFATGCGTMVAFVALFLWVILFGRHANVVPELPMNPMEFKYEKVNVMVDNVEDDSTRLSSSI